MARAYGGTKTTALLERQAVERAKWDAITPAFSQKDVLPGSVDFASWAAGRELFQGVPAFLGDLRGRRVLEVGCGAGKLAVVLARSGADVFASDLAPARVETARRRAELNGVADSIHATVAAAEELPYEDASFDLAVGTSVLHHLELEPAREELLRVLRPGAKAAFVEPMGMNPVLNFARDHLPYPGKTPRGLDKPLTYAEIEAWGEGFSELRWREVELLTMVRRALGIKSPLPLLRSADRALLARFPGLRRYCRHVIMYLRR